ncbi:ABC transporter ATP-binding protein [Jeotgalibacillus sp. R-1-5s-1]|uniref:ABC transporter ATP-binding protein n=1 Tax=Jeotgalibacillus sp. R-1-5s-1 TaxID=2555897 RepID=UPI00106DA5A6|nr:ABC transporter ATP-binding protein [Jeotgalibacillus sp. R-1-5s-1]TFE02454.1 ABC transporter ATP-binding protein [Jeotgalibacillus sp. R-1-5s-1]
MNVIECRQAEKKYRGEHGILHADFTIRENTITGVIGRNGAGKTTLLKMLAGYLKPTGGEVKVFGERPFNSLKVSANSMYLDEFTVYSDSTPIGELFQHHRRFYPNWDQQLAVELLAYFSISQKAVRGSLSKGQRNTLHGIIGLAARCPLTIFDEPTTGMDASVRKDFYRALLKDYLTHPRTILISSHHLDEIEDLLEDIVLIDLGKIILHLPVEELKEFGMAISGPAAAVNNWIQHKTVIARKEEASGMVTVIVKNDFTAADKATAAGLRFSPVSASDMSIYLTNREKGGIDDVFNKRQYS